MIWKLTVFTLTITLASVSSKGIPRGKERASNGSLAENGEFPYIVSITENYSHFCGGFVYNSRFIVTAASCVDGKQTIALKVYVGQLSLIAPDEGEQDIDVSSIIIFEGYNNQSKLHDIALVETSRAIVFSSHVEYIKYSDVNETLNYATFAGWGTKKDGGLEATRLHKLNLSLPRDCSSYDLFKDDYMICAGSDYGSPCQYDEGSPLVQNNIVVGVMSKSAGCTALSTIFTRVSAYYPWLMKFAGAQPE